MNTAHVVCRIPSRAAGGCSPEMSSGSLIKKQPVQFVW